MAERDATTSSLPLYRVDRFVVPYAARSEFLARVHMTHDVLRRQPGFVRDLLLEHGGTPGESVIVTIAEWENLAATEGARVAVAELHARENFSPQELFARTGIKAEVGSFRPLVD